MSMAMITFIPLAIALGFLYWASLLDDEHQILGLVFQLFFIPLSWVSINFALIDARLIYSSDVELVSGLGDLIYYLGWIFFIVGAYLVYNLFMNIYRLMQERKRQKDEDDD